MLRAMWRSARKSTWFVILALVTGCAHFGNDGVPNGDRSLAAGGTSSGETGRSTLSLSEERLPDRHAVRNAYLLCRWRDLIEVLDLQAGLGGISIFRLIFPENGIVEDDFFIFLPFTLIPEGDVHGGCLVRLAVHAAVRDMYGIADGAVERNHEVIAGLPWALLYIFDFHNPEDRGWRKLTLSYCRAVLDERRSEFWGVFPFLRTHEERPHEEPPPYSDKTARHPEAMVLLPVHWGDVRVAATTFPVACSIGLSPGELADFITGWFGLDLAGDDERK